MTVYFVGDKPSRLNIDPEIAFVGAKCYPRLMSWITEIGCEDYKLINKDKIHTIPRNTYIVALGAAASKALASSNRVHFQLPHPSGLNRQINDKEFIKSQLSRCKDFLNQEVLEYEQVMLCEDRLYSLHSLQVFKKEEVLILIDLDGGSYAKFSKNCRKATSIDLILYSWA